MCKTTAVRLRYEEEEIHYLCYGEELKLNTVEEEHLPVSKG